MKKQIFDKKHSKKGEYSKTLSSIGRAEFLPKAHRVGQLKSVDFCDIEIRGDLALRSGLNFNRLEGKCYRPDEVFEADQHGWPADWEGRLILALALLSQTKNRKPVHLDTIISMLPEHFNSRGYLGAEHPEVISDEQQLAGHSWLIRGLIEYYKINKDSKVLTYINTLIDNLFLPALDNYKSYPLTAEERKNAPLWVLSKKQTKTSSHAETSDTGCAFIALDGVTVAYEFTAREELADLSRAMIDRFIQLDLIGCRIQTHATLSCIRGMLRFYRLIGEEKYLTLAKEKYALYKTEAMSEAYGNYNWFRQPRWTEPCAIIDSFIAAVWLWQLTENKEYLDDGYDIYYNAMAHAFRENGSFGTDNCVGADIEDINIHPLTYEVYWCCNMRGGEGLSRAAEFSFFTNPDTIFVPFFHNCQAKLNFNDGSLTLQEETTFPLEGNIAISVVNTTLTARKMIKLCVPENTAVKSLQINGQDCSYKIINGFVTFDCYLRAGDKIEYELKSLLAVKPFHNMNSLEGYKKYHYGPLLLGVHHPKETVIIDGKELTKTGPATFEIGDTGLNLKPLAVEPVKEDSCVQVLFKK